MLQTAFGPSCMNRVSVFDWHKRFKEGRESVRDNERCERIKEVKTPELIGQIKNFIDKGRRYGDASRYQTCWVISSVYIFIFNSNSFSQCGSSCHLCP